MVQSFKQYRMKLWLYYFHRNTGKIFFKIWLCVKAAWKLPHSKQVSQVSFQSSSPSPQTKFRCHVFHRECKTLYTATGAQLGQAWGLRMLQSCLPAPTAWALPVGTPAPFSCCLWALGHEPPTGRSQSCRRYKDMDHQRLNPASAEGWTRHTWSRALSRAELSLLPSIWPRKLQSSTSGISLEQVKAKGTLIHKACAIRSCH